MKMKKPKRLNLTERQSMVYDAVASCHGSYTDIAVVSGVARSTILAICAGVNQPMQYNADAIIQAVEIINNQSRRAA